MAVGSLHCRITGWAKALFLRGRAAEEDAAPFGPKAEAPKVHIGFRLATDVVENLKASGPCYNARVEEALRAAGFGGEAKRAVSKRPA
jgi:BrnA antitoxin of type II toxin-antitoxin system